MTCEFAPDWTNREGFMQTKMGIVCLDWDALCTKCLKAETQSLGETANE